mgnify:CR=1 FL=1
MILNRYFCFSSVVFLTTLSYSPSINGQFTEPARKPMRSFEHSSPSQIYGAAISPNGSKVVTGTAGAKVWDVETGDLSITLHEHGNYVSSVAFSSDGRRVATGDWEGFAMIWDPGTGERTRSFDLDGPATSFPDSGFVVAVAFSPDGKYLAAGSNSPYRIKVWNIDSGEGLLDIRGVFTQYLGFYPDGQKILVRQSHNDRGWGEVWDIHTSEVVTTFEGWQATLSPDGSRVVTQPTGGAEYLLYDAETGQLMHSCPKPDPQSWDAALSPHGFLITAFLSTPFHKYGDIL